VGCSTRNAVKPRPKGGVFLYLKSPLIYPE